MPTLNDLVDSGLAGVRGFGTGASMGVVKYPAAGLMLALDRLVGEGRLSPGEALQLINEQQQADRTEHPYASYGGEIAGSIAMPGAAGARAATNIAKMTTSRAVPILSTGVIGAGQGAIAGFNERQNLDDAAVGAGVGGVFGAGANMTQQALNKATRAAAARTATVARNQAQVAREAASTRLSALQQAAQADPKNVSLRELVKAEARSVKGFEQSARKSTDAIRTLRNPRMSDAAALDSIGRRQLFNQTIANNFGRRAADSGLGFSAGGAGIGGVAGAGYGYLTDRDPVQAALLGAAGGGSTWQVAQRAVPVVLGLGQRVVPQEAITQGAIVASKPVARGVQAMREDRDGMQDDGPEPWATEQDDGPEPWAAQR